MAIWFSIHFFTSFSTITVPWTYINIILDSSLFRKTKWITCYHRKGYIPRKCPWGRGMLMQSSRIKGDKQTCGKAGREVSNRDNRICKHPGLNKDSPLKPNCKAVVQYIQNLGKSNAIQSLILTQHHYLFLHICLAKSCYPCEQKEQDSDSFQTVGCLKQFSEYLEVIWKSKDKDTHDKRIWLLLRMGKWCRNPQTPKTRIKNR